MKVRKSKPSLNLTLDTQFCKQFAMHFANSLFCDFTHTKSPSLSLVKVISAEKQKEFLFLGRSGMARLARAEVFDPSEVAVLHICGSLYGMIHPILIFGSRHNGCTQSPRIR